MPSPSGNRLPIHHPDYRYPESRNPYWGKIKELASLVFSDNETESHAGHWRSYFLDSDPEKPTRELHVEIGCNAAHVINEWAIQNPNAAYIGIDWKFKAIHRGAEKAIKRGIRNLLFFRAHAERLPFMFGKDEIDFLYLFFPDPWPKKAHWKNRFITEERLEAIYRILSPGGVFHIKTDHPGYFEWMEKAVANCKVRWEVVEHTVDLHRGHPAPQTLQIPHVTLFERIFIRQGKPVHSIKLKKGAS